MTKPTVSATIRELVDEGFIVVLEDKTIELTETISIVTHCEVGINEVKYVFIIHSIIIFRLKKLEIFS